jgi:hypothetical protein
MGDDQTLPQWADDELSKLLGMAEYNTRAGSHSLPEIYALVERVHRAFIRAREAVEKDNDQQRLIPRFLLARAYSSCATSIRLSLGGELYETHVVLRAEIEQAWYALHIAKDPAPTTRAEVWLRRNEDAAALSRCKAEFSIRSVRSTHEALDASTARDLHGLYERLIDFGGHPNQLGLLAGLTKSDAEKTTTYHVPVLCTDPLPMAVATHAVVAVAVGALKVFQAIYATRFQLVGLDTEIAELVAELNTVFRRYLPGGDVSGGAAGADFLTPP